MPRPKRYHACTTPGCPNLTTPDEPCPEHGRPTNASWSKDRDHQAHARFAKAVKQRDGWRCIRCGATTNLRAAHIVPIHQGGGYDPTNGETLCKTCDRKTDPYAR